MKRPTRIVCLGGGWVALSLARSLRSAIHRGDVDLTVVSRGNYLATHGLMAELLTCKVQPRQVVSPLGPLLKPAKLLNLEIEKIDVAKRVVTAKSVLDGRSHDLP